MKEVSCSKNRNFRNTSLQTNEFSKFSRALKSTAAHRRTVKSSEEQWRALGALHSVPPAWTPHRQTNWLAHRQGTARCLQSVRTAVAVQVVLPYKSIRVWSSVIRKIHGDFGPCQTRFASELGVHDIPWYSMIFHEVMWSFVESDVSVTPVLSHLSRHQPSWSSSGQCATLQSVQRMTWYPQGEVWPEIVTLHHLHPGDIPLCHNIYHYLYHLVI